MPTVSLFRDTIKAAVDNKGSGRGWGLVGCVGGSAVRARWFVQMGVVQVPPNHSEKGGVFSVGAGGCHARACDTGFFMGGSGAGVYI